MGNLATLFLKNYGYDHTVEIAAAVLALGMVRFTLLGWFPAHQPSRYHLLPPQVEPSR